MRASTRRSWRRSPMSRAVDGYGLADTLAGDGADRARSGRSPRARAFDLFGHSMGGRVALEVFRLAPERVRRLALCQHRGPPARRGRAGQARRAAGDRPRAGLRSAGRQLAAADGGRCATARSPRSTRRCGRCASMPGQDVFDAQIRALLGRPEQREPAAADRLPDAGDDRRARHLEPARAARGDRRGDPACASS